MFARLQILGRWHASSWRYGFSVFALALSGTLGLVACGQKGPLYMQVGAKNTPPVVLPSTLGTESPGDMNTTAKPPKATTPPSNPVTQ
jgi:predicted small lipoprotein YifL